MSPEYSSALIALLLMRAVLCVAELTGDNLCHKKEKYTVTMRVVVKEPVQIKTYTWCLQVPPRCTKYRIEMRDRYKIQTELRERVVETCCAGYVPDRTESHCLPVCRGCVHGVCATPDTCDCEPGYTGNNCDTECKEGVWGDDCEQTCVCQNGADCHHVTGDCKCSDGWRGVVCDVPCPKGTYGHACMKECNCPTNSTCHHITGSCMSLLNTTVRPHISVKPHEAPANISNQKNDSDTKDRATTITRTSLTTSDAFTELPSSTVTEVPTRTSVSATTQNFPLPSTEKHVLYTTPLPEAVETVVPQTATLVISDTNTTMTTTTSTTTTTTTTTAAITTMMMATSAPVTTTTETLVAFEENEKSLIPSDVSNNSITNVQPAKKYEDSSRVNPEDNVLEANKTDYSDEIPTKPNDLHQPNNDIGSTEPQNIQIPPNGVIYVSDGLMSDRREEDEGDGKDADGKSGVWDLVSSASVAGGVALALILMAAVTLLVAHRRNKSKVAISERKSSSVRKHEASQLPAPPVPQMYNYTEDATLPVRQLFPDVTYQVRSEIPNTDGLQLQFGDVTTTTPIKNEEDLPFELHHSIRAYLELNYDVPPSSLSSKTNSFQPEVEPEHLYDEIPCWKSNTTTTSTNTDTSRC